MIRFPGSPRIPDQTYASKPIYIYIFAGWRTTTWMGLQFGHRCCWQAGKSFGGAAGLRGGCGCCGLPGCCYGYGLRQRGCGWDVADCCFPPGCYGGTAAEGCCSVCWCAVACGGVLCFGFWIRVGGAVPLGLRKMSYSPRRDGIVCVFGDR
jgi:hypothetical protein